MPRELFANALYVRIPGPLRKVGAKLLALAACSGCDRQAWRRLTSSELFEKESACPSCCRRSRTAEDERRYRENYRAANKVTIDAWQRNYYKSQPWRTAGYRLKAKYGLSLSDKQVMLDAQGGRCKLCPREISLLKAAVDHSHAIELPDRIVLVAAVRPISCEDPPVRDGDDLYDVAWWDILTLPTDLSPVIVPPLAKFGLITI